MDTKIILTIIQAKPPAECRRTRSFIRLGKQLIHIGAAFAALMTVVCLFQKAIAAGNQNTGHLEFKTFVWLGAGILDSDADAPSDSQTFIVKNFLKVESFEHGRAVYTIDFQEQAGTLNKKFVEVLDHSINLNPDVRRQIAASIAQLGLVCDLNHISLKMFIAPMPDLASSEVDMRDSRRIASLHIFDCAKPIPQECKYHSYDNNDTGLELHGLLNKLEECYLSLKSLRNSNPERFLYQPSFISIDPSTQ